MASENSSPIRVISISRNHRIGEIRSGKSHSSRRSGGLPVLDDVLPNNPIAIRQGCNTVFPKPPANLAGSLTNENGPLASGATIQLIFWGTGWSDPGTSPRMNEVRDAVQTLMNSSYFAGLKQYGVDPGPLGKSIQVTYPEPTLSPDSVSDDDIHGLLWDLIGDEYPETDEAGGHNIYVVLLPPNSLPPISADGAHNHTFHYSPPFKIHVAWCVWIGFAGNLDGTMETFSHEVVETYTDPQDSGWIVAANSADESEIADVCAEYTGKINGVFVTSYYSLADNACIIPGGQSLRDFLNRKGLDGSKGIRVYLPPGTCLRQFMSNG